MQECMVVGVGKGVLFREVSSVQGCPYRGGCTVYISGRPGSRGDSCVKRDLHCSLQAVSGEPH